MGQYSANTSHKFLQLPNRTLFNYNLWDARATAELFFAMRRELQDPQLGKQWDYYTAVVQPLQRSVLKMQMRGLLVDRAAKRNLQTRISKELTATDELICRFATAQGFEYTDKFPNSGAQVAKLLFSHLGLRGAKQTDTGKLSADQESLTRALRQLRVRDEHARELIHNLFHRSRLKTIKERYFKITVDEDGRVRPRIKITGTKTFRYAYAEPAVQQYPPEIRQILRAEHGHVLLTVDYKQLEARILAVLSADETSLAVFRADGDCHRQNALDLFGLGGEEWESLGAGAKPRRNFAKSFLYGINYGGKAETMKTKLYCPCPRCVDKVPDTVELTREQIKQAESRWFAAHPAVARWQQDLARFVRRHNYYESPFGVRRMIAKPWGSELEREVKNIPMQLNAALLMNERQVRLEAAGLSPWLQWHDEFVFEVPERDADQVAADATGIMEDYCSPLGCSFPVNVEVGYNLGSYHNEDNPDGLRGYSD